MDKDSSASKKPFSLLGDLSLVCLKINYLTCHLSYLGIHPLTPVKEENAYFKAYYATSRYFHGIIKVYIKEDTTFVILINDKYISYRGYIIISTMCQYKKHPNM